MNKPSSTRASVSFPKEHYEMLERIAAEQKVSIAWLVRRAVEDYLDAEWPLLAAEKHETDMKP